MRKASALLERLAAPPVRATQERYRHELKYLINEGEHAALACRMAPVFKLDKHAQAGGYTIRSLYFDGLRGKRRRYSHAQKVSRAHL